MTFSASAAVKRRFLSSLEDIRHGRLRLTTPDRSVHHFGSEGPEAELTIEDWAVLPAILARGSVGFGESYVSGDWQSEGLEDLMVLALKNRHLVSGYESPGPLNRLGFLLVDRILRDNSVRGSSRNIPAHYDVGNEFYQLWLDPGMTYSSALFLDGESDLERAQQHKNDRILSKLSPGESILEIGCGWGGFAERAAQTGRRVTGLTLSPSQHGYAEARLDGRADIRLQDYRHATGRYDNIVSVEMIEAVGERWWPVYFDTLKARLAPGGRAVLQVITVPDAEFSIYRNRSDYIRQHVFPGGLLPCNAAMTQEAARAGLSTRGIFAFGEHYASTCRHWAARLHSERARIRRLGYGEPFLRNWQFYLEACAATFITGRTNVVQVELAHSEEFQLKGPLSRSSFREGLMTRIHSVTR